MLAVTDTGTGMDADTISHIFEPFYTTKPPGEGTGLGLSTVYGIVKQCGGDVWVYSELGQGTTFKIYLPQVKSLADLVRAHESPSKLPSGTETVLIIEDEERLRALACLVLRAAGYNVLEAARGDLALQVADRHQGAIDLVLTDMVMPGLSGQQVADRVRLRFPHVRVLYMSGYTDDVILRNGMAVGEVAFLEKPFTPAGLTRKVREVLDALEATG
jgi:two-component system cell cycle sensor histidine kinase/response regulator CckA